jgi:hypothetical protein
MLRATAKPAPGSILYDKTHKNSSPNKTRHLLFEVDRVLEDERRYRRSQIELINQLGQARDSEIDLNLLLWSLLQ